MDEEAEGVSEGRSKGVPEGYFTTTTRCHGMLMMQAYHQSIQESSEDSPSSNPIQMLHHVLKNVLRITPDERVSFFKMDAIQWLLQYPRHMQKTSM